MSRKPTIKISYPEASEKALQLTEAMVKRAPGKRVVETESEDSASPAGGELFADFDACSTSTSVDLTLTLNSASMDYALETLIRPNLTADERKRILGEDAEQTELALTPGEQEKQIDVGKIPDRDLRTILADLIQKYKNALVDDPERLIEDTIKEIDYKAGVIDLDETEDAEFSYKTYALFGLILATIELLKKTKRDSPVNSLILYLELAKEHLENNKNEIESYFLDALHIGWSRAYISPQKKENASGLVDQITERLYNEDRIKPAADPSWDDVEAEARQMQAPAPKQSAATRVDEDKTDETDETDDIEPGLLNDIEDGEEEEKQ